MTYPGYWILVNKTYGPLFVPTSNDRNVAARCDATHPADPDACWRFVPVSGNGFNIINRENRYLYASYEGVAPNERDHYVLGRREDGMDPGETNQDRFLWEVVETDGATQIKNLERGWLFAADGDLVSGGHRAEAHPKAGSKDREKQKYKWEMKATVVSAILRVDLGQGRKASAGIDDVHEVVDGSKVRYLVDYTPTWPTLPAVVVSPFSDKTMETRIWDYHMHNSDWSPREKSGVEGYVRREDGDFESSATGFSLIATDAPGGIGRLMAGSEEQCFVAAEVDGSGTSFTKAYGVTGTPTLDADGGVIVSFGTSFLAAPVVVATVQQDEKSIAMVVVTSISKESCRIVVLDKDQKPSRKAFSLLAAGPPRVGGGTRARVMSGVVSKDGAKLTTGAFDSASLGYAKTAVSFHTGASFGQAPVVVVSSEHVYQKALRQAEVHDVTRAGFKVKMVGKDNSKDVRWNDAMFHFIAFAPS